MVSTGIQRVGREPNPYRQVWGFDDRISSCEWEYTLPDLRHHGLTYTHAYDHKIGKPRYWSIQYACVQADITLVHYDLIYGIHKCVSHTRVYILQVYYCAILCYTRMQGNSDSKGRLTTWSSKRNTVVSREASVLEMVANWVWSVLWLWQTQWAKKTRVSHTIFVIRVKIRKIALRNSLYSKLEENG